MRNNWLWFMDLDGESPYIFPVDPLALHSFGDNVCSRISLLVDNSFHQSRHLSVPGSLAIEGAFNHVTKLAGALLFVFSGRSSLNMMREIGGNSHGSKPRRFRYFSQVKHITSNRQNFKGFCFSFGSKGEFGMPVLFGKISSFVSKLLHRETKRLQSHSILSLAAALIPPFDNLSKVLGGSLDSTNVMVQRPCEVARKGYAGLSFPELDWRRHAVEPRTGIEFPMILDNVLAGENNSNLCSELLVGTGSRAMTIAYLKSLKVYAFGFYVHPPSVCEKLGPKYASFSFDELNNRQGFYEDLLRQDVDMTVRLVVSCNGLKINTVKVAFEKSLRARLLKANPETDFQCIRTFGSCFTQDIPLPAGTTIDFRRTADGQLITEIEGKQIGAVRSKDLCRAFFSMYIGDIPVSEQTKEEIGRNVANIVRRQHCASILGGFHALQELPKWLSVIVDGRYRYMGSINRRLVDMQQRNFDSEGLRQRRTAYYMVILNHKLDGSTFHRRRYDLCREVLGMVVPQPQDRQTVLDGPYVCSLINEAHSLK